MKHLLLVFIGGGFGSVARFTLGKWLNNSQNLLPYGTMLANIAGSLIIGFVLGYLSKVVNFNENYALILATGFCGGFTTFSTFAYENHLFLKNGDYLSFLIYTLGSIILGIMAVFLGLYLSKAL